MSFFQIFYKIVRALRVNKAKPPSRNAFIVDVFGLESKKNPEMMKEPFLGRPAESQP